MNKLPVIIFIVAVIALGVGNAAYRVDQTQTAQVLQFGKPIGSPKEPGLHFKIPFVQNVVYFDNRLLEYDVNSTIIYTKDKKNLEVDAYVRWRITEPLQFYQAFKGADINSILDDAKLRIGNVIIGELKSELGLHVMSDIISQTRGAIMDTVARRSNQKLAQDGGSRSGVEIIDVRIKKADLPVENQKSVYERMKAERQQQADKYRSEGRREAEKIKAAVNLERAEILAEANRISQEIRGQADAEAARIYAEVYNQDPEFYQFTRSLESYEKAFKEKGAMLLDPKDMDYLKYLGQK